MAIGRMAIVRIAIGRIAVVRIAVVRMAIVRIAVVRIAVVRIAIVRIAVVRIAIVRIAIVRIAKASGGQPDAQECARSMPPGYHPPTPTPPLQVRTREPLHQELFTWPLECTESAPDHWPLAPDPLAVAASSAPSVPPLATPPCSCDLALISL
jgi:hypothetical protein